MMPSAHRAVALSALILSFLPLVADAGFRCRDGNLINEGDSVVSLLSQCGDPVYKSPILDSHGNQVGEQFFYQDRVDPSWTYTVNILKGRVTKVEASRQ